MKWSTTYQIVLASIDIRYSSEMVSMIGTTFISFLVRVIEPTHRIALVRVHEQSMIQVYALGVMYEMIHMLFVTNR